MKKFEPKIAKEIFTQDFRTFLSQVVKLIDEQKCNQIQQRIWEDLHKENPNNAIFSTVQILLLALWDIDYLKMVEKAKS